MITISVNLSLLRGSQKATLSGQNGVFIPASETYVSRKGDSIVQLNLLRIQPDKYDNTVLVKQLVAAKAYEAMTDEERRAIPILGHGK